MATQREIVSDMIAALGVSVPDLDTGIGSVTRKILDAVAESIAEVSMDSYLTEYAYDIDSKSGADLDEMLRLFGFTRLPAQRASGEVLFTRPSPSAVPVLIPQGTQVATAEGVVFTSVAPVALPPGDLSISVSCIALEPGADGNAAAASVTVRRSPIGGITAVVNPVAMTGGTDVESDAAFRARFKATAFRSMAGTASMYQGLALNDPDVSQANVVGAVRRWKERVEVVGGTATSTVQDATYIVPESAEMGEDLNGGKVLSPFVHFTFNHNANPPTVTSTDSVLMPDGIYDLEFDYVPQASRNVPPDGIVNRVDVYVNGERPQEATETLIFRSALKFVSTTSNRYYNQRFQRRSEVSPQVGNYFIPYSYVPIIDSTVNDQIVIDGKTYLSGVHFHLVHDVTADGMTSTSRAGIELISGANGNPLGDPANNSRFPVTYVYNTVPADVKEAINAWRVVGDDARVHYGKIQRLRLHFAVILERGYTEAHVKSALVTALSAFINTIGFRSVLQASDLLGVAANVSGVDSIRFLTDADNAVNYAIQRYSLIGELKETYATGTTPKRVLDVHFGDDEIPVLDDVVLDVRAQNTWGSV